MNVYTATPPAGVGFADVQRAALSALPTPPDGFWLDAINGKFNVVYLTLTLTAGQVSTFQAAVAAATADSNAPWRVQAAIVAQLTAAVTVLAGMQTQLAQLLPASWPDYTAANLATLVDLQHKVQAIANGPARDGNGGLAQLVVGLKNAARMLAGLTDGST